MRLSTLHIMNKGRVFVYLCMCLCIGCTDPAGSIEVHVDLDESTSLDAVTDYLQLDSLILVSSDEFAIVNCDRVIRCNADIFVLDKMQQAVFKVNTSSKSLQRIINSKGKAQNEYLSIADIAMDESGNIYVFDGDSRKINVYDSNGVFIRSTNVVYGTSMALSDNEIAINTNQLEDNQVVVFSPSGELLYQNEPYGEIPQYSLDDVCGIARMNDNFLYTTSFDYNIYKTSKSGSMPFVSFSFGDNEFDVQELKGLDYPGFQDMLRKNSDKVMSLRHLCVCDNLVFLSTDRSDQLMYDVKKNAVVVLSNVEFPYSVLFASPVSVGKDGQFCVVVSDSNMRNAYFPWCNVNKTKLPQLPSKIEGNSTGMESFWLLMGHVR